ncbi:MAG: peptidoglycan-binding domain-containing protein [Calothrix sp. MO_167.B42]|nr:peptidoglycan-binding domain-containing protein [Calothrix sp. MO_167.B42]
MPPLSAPINNLITNARFTASEMVELEKQVKSGRVKKGEVEAIATNYVDTLESGVGNWLNQLLLSLRSQVRVSDGIANLASETDLLNGGVSLPEDGRKHPSVRNVQRALIALASRKGQLGYMLPGFGADGDYGNETTKAVRAFQQDNGLVVDGKLGQKTAKAIDAALRQTYVPGITKPTPQDLVNAAQELCTGDIAQYYGVPQPWINIDPKHNVPTDRTFNFLINRWKCNLFGGNVLRKGGYEPPFYRDNTDDGKGEYPNANQWFKWTDKYAPRNGNPVRFQLIDEIPVTNLPAAELRGRIQELLAQIKPGDFLLVDHQGSGVQDGGHTRVAITNNFRTNGTISFAQASYDSSLIRQEGVDNLTNEEVIWLMRPNTIM